MSKKVILFVDGIPDDAKVRMESIPNDGKIRWGSSGSANLYKYFQSESFLKRKIVLDTRSDQELPKMMVHAIFNQISDPDSHKIALKKADDFYKAVSSNVPFFNPPAKIMKITRDGIYRMLVGINGLNVPKTIKIQPKTPAEIHDVIQKEGFEYPVIFRQAGDHGGVSTVKVDDDTEEFHVFALDGREYYITQFVEYQDEGYYIKYRLVVIEGKVYLRHVKVSDQWMVHHKTQIKNPEPIQKKMSKKFLGEMKEAIEPILAEVYQCLELDYFGVDCHIGKNMELLVFEVNPNMSILLQAKGDAFGKQVDKIKRGVLTMIENRINRQNLLKNSTGPKYFNG